MLDKQGHVITNNHVVAEAAKDNGNIEVIDRNGTHSKAKIVGRSPVYDIAVLKDDRGQAASPPARSARRSRCASARRSSRSARRSA